MAKRINWYRSQPWHLTRVGVMSRAFMWPTGWVHRLYLRSRGYSFDTPWSPHLMSKARVWK